MKELKQILVIASGTCLGHILFALLTWLLVGTLGLSMLGLLR